MASIGWSWVVAGLAVSGARPGLSSALAGWGLLLAASLAVARYRAGAWHAAATVMRHTIEHVEAAAPRPACVVGLPDHLEHAYVRRNASPAMEQMLWPHREVRLVARGPDCDQPPEVIVPVSAPH
jgi:hypothetical protein